MLVLNLDTGKETHFAENTAPQYALSYAAASGENCLTAFWRVDKDALYRNLPFLLSARLGKKIMYLGEYGVVLG